MTDERAVLAARHSLADEIHRRMAKDPLLPPCGGTHLMGYATCQRIAAIFLALPPDPERLAAALVVLLGVYPEDAKGVGRWDPGDYGPLWTVPEFAAAIIAAWEPES